MKWAIKHKHKDVWVVLLATIVLAGCTLLAMTQQAFLSLERLLFYAVYNVPEILRLPTYILTQLGSVGALAMAVVVAFVCGRKKMSVMLLISGVLATLAASATKMLVARPRPAGVLPDVMVHFDYVDGFGFPSGHTAIATAVALTLMPFVKKQYQVLLWILIIGVALSRMILGAHVPLDLIGGFCIGVIAATVTRVVINRTKLSKSH